MKKNNKEIHEDDFIIDPEDLEPNDLFIIDSNEEQKNGEDIDPRVINDNA